MQLIDLFMALSEYHYWYWVFRVVRCFSTWLHFWQAIFQCQNAKGEHIFFQVLISLSNSFMYTYKSFEFKKKHQHEKTRPVYLHNQTCDKKSRPANQCFLFLFPTEKSRSLLFLQCSFLFRDRDRKLLLGWLDFYRSRCKFCIKMQDFELWMSIPIFDL